jgi:glycosyltransferase involved in cell wall biosynthesis
MRIIISVNSAWNIINFRLELIRAIQEKGNEVIALAPADKYVKSIESLNVRFESIFMLPQGKNPFSDIRTFVNYWLILRRIKPDYLLTFTIKPNIYGNLASRLLGIKVISNVSGLGNLFLNQEFDFRMGLLLYKWALRSTYHVFFQNGIDHHIFLDNGIVRKTNSSVLPGSGVNTEEFSTNRQANKGKKLLFVGRIIAEKGVFEFIEATKRISRDMPDIEIHMVGEYNPNSRNKKLLEQMSEIAIHEQFFVHGMQDEMVTVYAESDIFVLPSYREGLSRSLLEAASMQLPIVTTDVPGCREVVSDGINGYLCKSMDSNDLELKIRQIISLSEKERLEMGVAGRQKVVSKYDYRFVSQSYLKQLH